jgi:class 3 adenylate cyclase/predicted ATPase
MDVVAWLRGLGLEQYAPAFCDNDVDGEVLPELTSDDLISIGVTSVGHRRKLLAAIASLGAAPPAGTVMAAPRDAPASADAERRQLTVMFCDLVGSTALAARLDPEDLREVIGAYHRAVAEIAAGFEGFVAKYMGDGVLAYFGYPRAHEDDAERAARAGLGIVEAVGRLDVGSVKLQARVGIATGLVVVGDLIGEGSAQEQSVVGETPNLAARLQALAEPNAVIVADSTRRQVGALFEMRDLGPQNLKGFGDINRAWRVLGESGVESRFAAFRTAKTPLVGRDEEIDLLLRRWGQAKTGEGRVVLLSAEPGIGKSRLTEALVERIAAEQPARLRYSCSPHHQDSALFPIIGQLERVARFAREDPPGARCEKLAALLGDRDDLAPLAELLSLPVPAAFPGPELSPQRKKELTFAALLHQLERVARQRPVLMVFEDVHWIDPTTRELLDRTIMRVESLPVLLVATFRPEFQPPWTGQPHVTTLALSRLARREAAALVRQMHGNAAALPAEIVEEIVERTDGVPLFLEEVTKVVLEAAAGVDGARDAIAAISETRIAVPATLQASLMARLDRLGSAARETAQVGAAIGRDFSYELVAAAAQRGEAETKDALDRLVAAGLVFQRGTPPAAEYQFKHALVQDTAYGSLLRGPRQALHARIAAAMQARALEIVERAPEILAHHLSKAGEPDRAATQWLEAGRRAAGRSANAEAAAHLARGIAGLQGLPETQARNRQELAMQLALGPVLLSSRGFGSVESKGAYQRAAELARGLEDDRARFAATWGLWITARRSRSDNEIRLRHLREMVGAADRIDDPELSLQAHHSSWATWVWVGEFLRAQDHVRQGLALYDPVKHRHHALMYGGHDPAICGKGVSSLALWALGYPDQAVCSIRQSIGLAEQLKHVPSLLHAFWFAGLVHQNRRDVAAAGDCADRLVAVGREHGLKQYQAIGSIVHGWTLTRDHRGDQGLAELRSAVTAYSGTTAEVLVELFMAELAEAELCAGNAEAAVVALARGEETDSGWWRAEFLRLRGDLHRRGPRPDSAAAEGSYREAIAVARRQSAKSLELRAANRLAQLWREEGRSDAARDLLAPVYGWFTEGFDTPDLKQAKALLDELA